MLRFSHVRLFVFDPGLTFITDLPVIKRCPIKAGPMRGGTLAVLLLVLTPSCLARLFFSSRYVNPRFSFPFGEDVSPSALEAHTLAGAEVSPDGSRVILRFEDAAPISVGPVVHDGDSSEAAPEEDPTGFINALATSPSEPMRAMEDPHELVASMLKRGFNRVTRASFAAARRGLRVDLCDKDGNVRTCNLFCARCYGRHPPALLRTPSPPICVLLTCCSPARLLSSDRICVPPPA